jgi:hypothetical protein
MEMAMCLSGEILLGHLLTMEQINKSFYDSYPHDEETGACLIFEELGQKWWELIAAELGKGRERGEEWQALWALYQEAKKRKILEGLPRKVGQGDREGSDGPVTSGRRGKGRASTNLALSQQPQRAPGQG